MILSDKPGVFALKDIWFFIFYRGEVLNKEPEVLSSLKITYMSKQRTQARIVCISIRMEKIRLVKVRAFKRFRNGKVEKVKAHFRRYWSYLQRL